MTFTPITFGSGLSSYNYLTRTRETQQSIFDKSPLVKRETEEFSNKIKDVTSSDQLMENRTLLKVALGAFGLVDDLDNRAFIQKILDSDLSDRDSLANRLADKRYLAFAEAFNFKGEDGPSLPFGLGSTELGEQMAALNSSDDLLSDRALLRASLEQFGLEDNVENTYYLKQVLDSDLNDASSFANRMSDPRLIEFAEAFDFFDKSQAQDALRTTLDDVVELFGGTLDAVDSTDALLDAPDLLKGTLKLFGFDDIYTEGFLADVLNSDLSDEMSFANQQSDARWAAISAAFNFGTPERDILGAPVLDSEGETVFEPGKLKSFIDLASNTPGPFETVDSFLDDKEFRDATFDLLGLPNTVFSRGLAARGLDPDSPGSAAFAKQFPDPKYRALFSLIEIKTAETARTYPEGFVEQVTESYLERQFEIQVGEVDPTMRIALSLERELKQVTSTSQGNDSRWFAIMSSPPLRKVFEGAFRLPESFGSIDIEQQLVVMKDRSERFFGTTEVADYLDKDQMNSLRQDYLLATSTQTNGTTSSANLASLVLATFS